VRRAPDEAEQGEARSDDHGTRQDADPSGILDDDVTVLERQPWRQAEGADRGGQSESPGLALDERSCSPLDGRAEEQEADDRPRQSESGGRERPTGWGREAHGRRSRHTA
jgi:hypothetical protein